MANMVTNVLEPKDIKILLFDYLETIEETLDGYPLKEVYDRLLYLNEIYDVKELFVKAIYEDIAITDIIFDTNNTQNESLSTTKEKQNWIIGISGSDMDNVYTYRVYGTKEEVEKLIKAHMEEDKQKHIDIYDDEVFYEKENNGQKIIYGCTCFVDHHNDYTATPELTEISVEEAINQLNNNASETILNTIK